MIILTAMLGLTCANPASAQAPDNADVQTADTQAAAAIGTYVGMFGPHKITVSIEKIVGRTVLGYSVVTGNERAFSGSWQTVAEGISFIGKEPGDHPEDGVFNLSFNATNKTLAGRWDANDKKKPSVDLSLKARKFKYDPSAGEYAQASSRVLKEKDVENLTQAELRLMRNEIYARHGYSFIIQDMQEHFAKVDWYMPVALDVADRLTPLEAKNAALIKRYESYSSEYYDKFGR
ncbi:YARHG domain-containing protein [Prosthecobacter fusiformis]|uniref:YARHG domain-containing protein n=1 Tax=Prosthecobacter fusiformis TaxID=48464 RepID=UPI001414D85C|nr:YARHG domain-containing protein [Prosthecobacter fusiformis]